MEIRKATIKDLKEIEKIFKREYSKFPYNEKWTKKTSLLKIKEYFRDNVIFVLEYEKKIIGFIIGHIEIWDKGDEGFIDEVVVLSKFQKKGYGKILLNYLINCFKKKNCYSLGLMCNPESKAFKIYKKMGFNKPKNLIFMTKKLK